MITYEIDASGLERAAEQLQARIPVRVREGLDLTLEQIAARARETNTFVDRSGALRASIQSAGSSGQGDELVGVVSFAARARNGYLYGMVQEFGNKVPGIQAKRFIRDAIDAQDGALIEGGLAEAFRDAGFRVVET